MLLSFMQWSFWKHQRNSALILIIQLCQLFNKGGQLIKDANFFSFTQGKSNKDLAVPITVEDELQTNIL